MRDLEAILMYDDLLDYLEKIATPEEILAFQASEASSARAEDLAEKHEAGQLSPEEYRELEEMLYVNGRVSVMKAKALKKLKQS